MNQGRYAADVCDYVSTVADYEVLCFLRDCGLFSLAFPVWDAVDTVGGLLADHNGDFTFEAFASLLGYERADT